MEQYGVKGETGREMIDRGRGKMETEQKAELSELNTALESGRDKPKK